MTEPIEPTGIPTPTPRRRLSGSPIAVAPLLSLVGLLIVGLLTVQIYRNWTPVLATATDTPSPTPVPVESGQTPTPAPTATPVTNIEISVPGTLVYAKNGELWVQSGTTAHQLTDSVNGSKASQPAFSPDGQWIYYIDTRLGFGHWIDTDINAQFSYPVLVRIHPDGTGKKDVVTGLIKRNSLRTFFWLRQPAVSPTGYTVAVVSDGPGSPGGQDELIHYITVNGSKLNKALPLAENTPVGLSDPAFSPSGRYLAYTMEQLSHSFGVPSIWLYNGSTSRRLASGYRAASWSPDGKYIAATKVSGFDLDVVVLDASSGKMVGRVTSDGTSWGPVWSPDGNKLVYSHLSGATVNLNMVYISGTGPNFTFKIEPKLTDYSGLDGGSTPTWYIPGFGLVPTPAPTPSSSATPIGTPSSALPSATPSEASPSASSAAP
jgi:Tol biopolymer transport system component